MAEKQEVKTISEEEEKNAFVNGVQITKFFTLFNYFLQETPEGKKAKQEMSQAWRETFELLRDNKQLRGNEFSCSAWLKQVQKELLKTEAGKDKKDLPVEETKQNNDKSTKSEAKKTNARKVKPLRFKNV